jgi:4-hydroxybenzoate polyprenyltransferase
LNPSDPPRKDGPDALTIASFVLLGLVAVALLLPLLGGPTPSPYLVIVLLVGRLGVQFLRSRHDPNLRRPASWAFDVILIGLLFYVASNQPGG